MCDGCIMITVPLETNTGASMDKTAVWDVLQIMEKEENDWGLK